jgi:hypothetical protein
MIIGVSGKIGSGKDTVGKIIQYLWILENQHILKLLNLNPFESLIERNFPFNNYSTWQIKKYADKLKECVSIITGIPRADLEKIEVKNSDLGDNWERWYNYHYKLKGENNPKGKLDNYCATELEVERQHDKCSNFVSGHCFVNERVTVRIFLQELGTEVGRQIHPNFWINALFTDYKEQHHSVNYGTTDNGERIPISTNITFPNWIITDVRYPNELEAIKNRDGIIIRVNRNSAPVSKNLKLVDNSFVNEHLSETALDNAEFDYTIDNNGSIEELIEKIKTILKIEKLI